MIREMRCDICNTHLELGGLKYGYVVWPNIYIYIYIYIYVHIYVHTCVCVYSFEMIYDVYCIYI